MMSLIHVHATGAAQVLVRSLIRGVPRRIPWDLADLAAARGSHPGAIGQTITLGTAAAKFAFCCTPLTGIIIKQPATGTSGSTNGMGRGRSSTGDPATVPILGLLGSARLEPIAVGRAQRLATTAQRKALTLRDNGCVIPGCTIPANQCQPHHVRDWSKGGATDIANLALACWSHHRQLDLNRWRLTRNPETTGSYWLTTKTPRHTWRQ